MKKAIGGALLLLALLAVPATAQPGSDADSRQLVVKKGSDGSVFFDN